MSRARLALVTHLWPLPGAPHAGKPIYETALRLGNHVELEVFCPVPRYPRLRWLQPSRYAYHRADPAQAPPGLKTHYLEYGTLPGIGRAFNGQSTQRVLEPALSEFRPDLVLSYWLYPTSWAAVRAGARLRLPVIVGSRGSDLHGTPDMLVRRMTASTLRSANAVLAVTEDLRRTAIRLGSDPARTHSIPNGCDPALFHPRERAEARRALGLPACAKILVQVGHLIPSKGVFDLLTAFGTLAPDDPNLLLVMVGEGPAEAAIRERARASGLTQQLLLPGARPASEIALWLNAADVVCLASHGEGCPNVVIEALCCGRPVVGTDVGGIPELVGEGCGLLVPPRNPRALAEAISRTLEFAWNPGAISARFSRTWDDVARETLAICLRCLDQPQPQRVR